MEVAVEAEGFPEGAAAVVLEGSKGPGFGEAGEGAVVEPGAQGEVFEGVEGGVVARGDDALSFRFLETLDVAKTHSS